MLVIGDAGYSFQLLIADRNLVTRIFLSEHGEWDDVIHNHPIPLNFLPTVPILNRLSPPLVIGMEATTIN